MDFVVLPYWASALVCGPELQVTQSELQIYLFSGWTDMRVDCWAAMEQRGFAIGVNIIT